MEPKRGAIDSDGYKLGYSIEGEGRPLLVIGSSIYYPRTFSQDLRTKVQLIFIDHRGFVPAPANAKPDDHRLEVILQDVERIRQHLGIQRPVIVGHSGHGYMALEYAKRYPSNASHVVMIATGPSHADADMHLAEQYWQEAVCPERKEKFHREISQLASDIERTPEKKFISLCLRLGARMWKDWNYDASPLWQGVYNNMPALDYLWGHAFKEIDVTKGLAQLKVPVFLALGRFDYSVAPYSSWARVRPHFHDLTVRVFEQSSHTPQLEESELFDRELIGWLTSKS